MCFFNAFLTHLRDLFLNRAWSLSSALDAFSCKQSLIFACRLNYPAKLHAATACRFCVRPAHRCKNFAGGFVGGVRGFLLPAISASSLASSSSITTNEFRSRIFHFIFNEMKCTAYSRAERSSPADGVSSCKQSPRLSLSSAAPLKNTPLRVCFFNVCKVFCTHLHNFFEIVRGACRLRSMPFLASNPSSSLAV